MTNKKDEIIKITVEHTQDFEGWKDALKKMVTEEDFIIEVFRSIPCNDDTGKFDIDNVDKSDFTIDITLSESGFSRWFDFIVERAKKEVIAINSTSELQDKLDIESGEYGFYKKLEGLVKKPTEDNKKK